MKQAKVICNREYEHVCSIEHGGTGYKIIHKLSLAEVNRIIF
jgi:hypothetical protein